MLERYPLPQTAMKALYLLSSSICFFNSPSGM